jgi:hypothetical protein
MGCIHQNMGGLWHCFTNREPMIEQKFVYPIFRQIQIGPNRSLPEYSTKLVELPELRSWVAGDPWSVDEGHLNSPSFLLGFGWVEANKAGGEMRSAGRLALHTCDWAQNWWGFSNPLGLGPKNYGKTAKSHVSNGPILGLLDISDPQIHGFWFSLPRWLFRSQQFHVRDMIWATGCHNWLCFCLNRLSSYFPLQY